MYPEARTLGVAPGATPPAAGYPAGSQGTDLVGSSSSYWTQLDVEAAVVGALLLGTVVFVGWKLGQR